MKTKKNLEKLRNIKAKDLAETINLTPIMARKYKKYPHEHTPSMINMRAIENEYDIPIVFWSDVIDYMQKSDNEV